MAAVMSAKRPRAPTNGIEASGVGRDLHNNKRRRRSPEDEEQSVSDEESQAEDDASEDDQDNAREENQIAWATQQVQRDFRATANKQNVPTDSGIIEEIQCINFMCHEHLTVTLGPLINFIIGHNGSGKSAVLTALQICLGGKATATNRAQNLKSLIKEGRERCSVQVRIKNQGPLAYKPRDYGKSIIVERHFTTAGASGFKLKDENNRIVSTKKTELEDILDAFSMQIDNPMNVLTQDMARQFLNHSTPKDKYKFFLQGTQLENLNRDYQQIEASLESMNSKAELKETDLAKLRKDMEELASRARRAENLEKMRAKEADLAHQAAWAKVQEEEAEVAEAETGIQEAEEKIQGRAAEAEEAAQAFERATASLEAAQESITEITIQREPAQQLTEELDSAFKEVRSRLLSLRADERNVAGEIKQKQASVNNHKREIEQHRQRQAEADNGLYAAKQIELEDAKEAAEQAKQAYTTHTAGFTELRESTRGTQNERDKADKRLQELKRDLKLVQDNMQSLQGNQRNWFDSYQNPSNLRKLLQAIDTDKRFREKPVGPLGRHVKLVEAEWGNILEKQFGAALNGFVVTSKPDQTVLSELMRRNNWQGPIFIGNRNPINTAQHEPDPSLKTWMKALKIEDHLVRNQFIINQGIEQTVLIEDPNEGNRFMQDGGPLTKNVKMCFTFKDGDTRRGRVINYTANGGINNSPIDEYRGQFRMQVDKDAQIREGQTRLAHAQQELRSAEDVCRQVMNQFNLCRDAEQSHVRQGNQLKLRLQRAQDAVERIEGELNDATPDAAAIEVLQEQLDTAQEELQRVEGVFEDMIVQRDKLNAESSAAKKALEDSQTAAQDLKAKLDKAHVKVRTLQGRREEALRSKNQILESIARMEENKASWVEARDERQREVDSTIEQAKSVCAERVPVPHGKTSDDLIKVLNKLIATRRETEKSLGGSQEELLRQANAAKQTHMEAMREFESMRSLRNHLINTLHNRRLRWKQFRSGISVRARVTFNYLLSERKFRGTLSIDHKKAMLDIHVQPDSMEKTGEGRQTKTLSGGEKSFSTVCLLLSLWDAMGSPIRCLDEFDVFMDSVNRDRSMKMIIAAARRSVGRQFIFITPQAMNSVQQDSDVKIIRMLDPERGQTALNFGQQ